MPSRGDILDLIQQWQNVKHASEKSDQTANGKFTLLPTQTMRTLMDLGSKMAQSLEEIARR